MGKEKNAVMVERGRLGGKACVAKYGIEEMRRRGKKGFAAFCSRHCGGDVELALHRIREMNPAFSPRRPLRFDYPDMGENCRLEGYIPEGRYSWYQPPEDYVEVEF